VVWVGKCIKGGCGRRGQMASNMTTTNESDTLFPDRTEPMALVRAYWEALRQDGKIPFRSDIDPRGIEEVLSSTFLIERVAPGMARFRIAGMDLSDVMGMDVRGLPLSMVFVPEARAALASKLEQVFHNPAIMEMTLVASGGLIKPSLSAKLLVLPLRDETGQVRLALGCFALKGNIGRSPRRFIIEKMNVTAVASTGPSIAPSTGPSFENDAKGFAPKVITNARIKDFAESPTPFNHKKQSGSKPAKPSYLRLID
jgi:hypothetical protein